MTWTPTFKKERRDGRSAMSGTTPWRMLRPMNNRGGSSPTLLLVFGIVFLLAFLVVIVILGEAFILALVLFMGGLGILIFIRQPWTPWVGIVLIALGVILFIEGQANSLALTLGGFPVR